LCLYGNPDGTWDVQLPAEEVPPELPEPALGINFARDGMQVNLARANPRATRRDRVANASRRSDLIRFDRARERPTDNVAMRGAFDDAAQGLARVGRRAQRRVVDGGGVLLRRQV